MKILAHSLWLSHIMLRLHSFFFFSPTCILLLLHICVRWWQISVLRLCFLVMMADQLAHTVFLGHTQVLPFTAAQSLRYLQNLIHCRLQNLFINIYNKDQYYFSMIILYSWQSVINSINFYQRLRCCILVHFFHRKQYSIKWFIIVFFLCNIADLIVIFLVLFVIEILIIPNVKLLHSTS